MIDLDLKEINVDESTDNAEKKKKENDKKQELYVMWACIIFVIIYGLYITVIR